MDPSLKIDDLKTVLRKKYCPDIISVLIALIGMRADQWMLEH